MCFSATASFIVGGSLTVVGTVTLRRATNRTEFPFAAIPLLFGVQQIIEGILWLSFYYDFTQLKTVTTYMFTIFSHVLWPIYIPFAVGSMEQKSWRRKAMWGFRFIGIVVGIFLFILIATLPLTAVANEYIIYVSPHFYKWPMMTLYITATCLVSFFSSYSLVRLFGILALLLLIVAYWLYSAAFFSVWCFFAAILSAIIYHFFKGKES
jgi:hypothetical protein